MVLYFLVSQDHKDFAKGGNHEQSKSCGGGGQFGVHPG
jgi:hypothetical protein